MIKSCIIMYTCICMRQHITNRKTILQVGRFTAWTKSGSMPAILVAMRSFLALLAAGKVNRNSEQKKGYRNWKELDRVKMNYGSSP